MSKPTIKGVVEGVHMGLGHTGLAVLLKKTVGIHVQKLEPGELVMCLNRQGDKMKIIGHQGLVVGYLRMPNKQPIMREALRFIPDTFGSSGGFNYDAACRKVLDQRLSGLEAQRAKRKASPLEAARAAKAS